jgi:TolB-like protein
LKNIAEPIHVYSLEVGQPAQAKPAEPATPAAPTPRKRRFGPAPLAAALAALRVVIAGGAWWFLAANRLASVAAKAPTEAAHLSIVVLPFANLSGDPAQDYFADGVTENLTTELSGIKGSFVIARNTAFTYKGKSIDAKEIGKELGVRYLLEGSVQREQTRVRVNAQLVDANSGAHIWAERFDDDLADLFKLQDQVVARLANTLNLELIKAEAARSARSTNPDANDLVMRALGLMNEQGLEASKDKNNAARTLYERALAIDPNNAQAISGVAATYFWEYKLGWGNSDTNYDAKILDGADRAITLAPNFAFPYWIKSTYLNSSNRFDEAIRATDAGLAVNPNDASFYVERTRAKLSLRRFDEAKSDLQQAVRLSPHSPFRATWDVFFGDIEVGAGRPEAAIVYYQKALDAGDRHYWTTTNLAAAYALLRFRARWTRRSRTWPKPFASIRASPSNGIKSTERTFRLAPRACARPGFLRSEAT